MKTWDLVMIKQMPTNYTAQLLTKYNIKVTNDKNHLGETFRMAEE